MTKYGIIADVHANLEALEAVLLHLDRENVDEVVCLGDIVGYHADANACVALVRSSCKLAISGNHDRAATGADIAGDFGFLARRAIAWTTPRLDPDHAAYLRALPPTLAFAGGDALAVHAGLAPEPNDRFHVITPARISANLAQVPAGKLCFFGHTHRPAHHVAADGTTAMINPGSVGQPRDRDWRAACAVFDTRDRKVTFERLEYDRVSALAKADAAGLLAPPTAARRRYEAARSVMRDAADLARRAWRITAGAKHA